MNANDSIFYTSLYSFLGGFVLAVLSILYKSKCKSVKCCGCEINRDTCREVQIMQVPLSRDRSDD